MRLVIVFLFVCMVSVFVNAENKKQRVPNSTNSIDCVIAAYAKGIPGIMSYVLFTDDLSLSMINSGDGGLRANCKAAKKTFLGYKCSENNYDIWLAYRPKSKPGSEAEEGDDGEPYCIITKIKSK